MLFFFFFSFLEVIPGIVKIILVSSDTWTSVTLWRFYNFCFLLYCVLYRIESSEWAFTRLWRLEEVSVGCLIPCYRLIQGPSEQVTEGYFQLGFEHLLQWRVWSLSGQPVPLCDHPHSQTLFLSWNTVFLYLDLYPLPLVLSLCSREKSLAQFSLLGMEVHHLFIHMKYLYPLRYLLDFSSSG